MSCWFACLGAALGCIVADPDRRTWLAALPPVLAGCWPSVLGAAGPGWLLVAGPGRRGRLWLPDQRDRIIKEKKRQIAGCELTCKNKFDIMSTNKFISNHK
jgi:hypothetical protein